MLPIIYNANCTGMLLNDDFWLKMDWY